MKLKDYREDLFERLKDPEYSEAYLRAVLAEKDKAAFLTAQKDVVDTNGQKIVANPPKRMRRKV
jgi:DNA-binding phage protein